MTSAASPAVSSAVSPASVPFPGPGAGRGARLAVSPADPRACAQEPGVQELSLQALTALARALRQQVESVVVGKTQAVQTAVATLLAGGHLLIEDVPGVGKTTLASALARCLDLSVSRIQFTSDLLPADITGVSVYDQSTREFRFHPGPVFANVVVADEVNRATPRTQSALLEAMGEDQVSVEGRSLALPDPFMVVATQNPLDMEGTYRLPEAQRDRFMTRISMGYPDAAAETAMHTDRAGADPLDALRALACAEDVRRARSAVARLHLAEPVAAYIVALVAATRHARGLTLGASPRAGLQLAALARARAAAAGRGFVSPDDVAQVADAVLTHRLVPAGRFASAAQAHQAAGEVLAQIVSRTPVPGL
ncbi:AAA family ATPase [Actinomyces wuliandei]|uniref:AAA family ATPase n=1 Tax=Actinomyces wuliandei TaxID=2057743 RepID=UPI000FDAAEF6|nr:AAA family ATPase [Actinomyces wuliandei]